MKPVLAQECRILRNIKVPMRDGTKLATNVYLPLKGETWPVVLVRTAYNRTGCFDAFFPRHGMALVVQDCRGRYESEGEFYPFINESTDGRDTLEWIGRQPWCNGKIGMFGDSYLAATQFHAALTGNPLLRALNPRFMAGNCWKRAYYCDGAFSLALSWSWLCFESAGRISQANAMPLLNVPEVLKTLPIITLDEASGAGRISYYRDYVRHSRYDDHWKTLNIREQACSFQMPVFLIGGWYDYYAAETFANFMALRKHAPTAELRDSHRLLIGPWTHGISGNSTLGEIDFGKEALRENDATQRWLNAILHDKSASEFQQAPVRIFVMGLNKWRDEYEWPLARTRYVRYYLREGGKLALNKPGLKELPDHYTYDPLNPVPTLGGNHSIGPYNPGLYEFVKPGPFDQRKVEERPDVLVYTSEVLEQDTEVTGPVTLKLFASSSAVDTDFVAKLTDVYPDGKSINITEGIIRARFREDVWGSPKLLQPGTVYEFTIDLQVTSNVFKAGHRIRVNITSSNFPLWDRNLNTGNEPGMDTRVAIANQTIYHDVKLASHIILPVVG
jgi:putative CocE/NonD family hydrolase